ncbi:MAG TPA: FxsA family protein [Phycisphaerae bacterium]|nr:FxsA family protein [Phycisphaerae bacterium]HOM52514.1 FxsA family protein [Phycisphaerae bacterium]HOQ85356.1 FxsA family protein [Phycisphaerae bacterium]HPP27788.1 FxsA family protein [Phycisphaerae bacterium]HPU27163.1 FxsA family protein [Phycisphaerae bacterium]
MFRLALLLILWPLIELYLLIQIGRATSAFTALTIVILTGVVGAALAKREGLKTYHRIRQELAAGHIPGDHLVDALMILVAGILLITPGLISDTVGIALLVPHFRRLVREHLKRRLQARFAIRPSDYPGRARPTDDIIDVEVREIDRKPLGRDDDPR